MRKYKLSKADEELISAALEVLKRNFDDGVYDHTVGCAIRCKNGKVYTGVNCDGVHGSCAEYITFGAAYSAGEREFDTIVAVNDICPGCVISPCGNCRQLFCENCPDIKVIINDGERIVKVNSSDLLPYPWRHVEC